MGFAMPPSSPTLSFGDGDTGFYQSDADAITFTVGGRPAPRNPKKVHVARRRAAIKHRKRHEGWIDWQDLENADFFDTTSVSVNTGTGLWRKI